jgi:hypothetical protein
MKVPKAYVGSAVKVTWRDPISMARKELWEVPTGMDALATWVEYGVLDDLTDGVLRIVHSEGFTSGKGVKDEICYTAVWEVLVVDIRKMVEEPVSDSSVSGPS